MPRAAVKQKGLSSVSSVEDAVSLFLKDLRAELPASAVKKAEFVIGMLIRHLSECDEANADEKFSSQSGPAELIDHLDRFLRYCVMRELVLSFEEQEFVFFVTYDFCEWLNKTKLLPQDVYAAFQLVRDNHMDMWKQACAAAHEIHTTLGRRSLTTGNQVIELGRHDIARIDGDQIWLEVWSLPILPKNRNVGPITLPKKLAAVLQVGWMITCELAKSKSGWHIVDVGNIYPSLPFK